MLVVETVAKIRRAYFVQGKAIKAISRELGVSRKVVRKVQSWLCLSEQRFVSDRWSVCPVQAAALCGSRVK